ncbi:alpha/beta fold hydrolase [Salinarchaeum sp. Harcht-Bsk1]|uniref:alpha/beta fold hydrolase n=1 Tax=Salinarchaeum sp. Harcht-Bsk1 TaxID=1333523 RepID=UPI00067771E1|nr:alpha/beta fold hydrolase [Salinarchaeum sp. Harcht-Bsk1]
MRGRSFALAAGAGIAAIGNRALGRAGGALPPALAGDQDYYRWRGMEVAYAALGDPDDPPVVLLHDVGVVGTSREFAGVAEALAEDHRVYAPDLPGYGRSDRPPLTYSASIYEAFVGDFLAEVPDHDAGRPAVVASGLTASYAALAAPRADVERLVLVTPAADTDGRSVARRALVRSPVLGTAIYNWLTSTAGLRNGAVGDRYYGRPDQEYVEYCWQSAHQPGARFAPASYLSGYLDPTMDLETALADVDADVTLLWGRESTDPSLAEGRALAEATDARLVVVDYAKRLPHLEHPTETLAALELGLVPANA